MKDPNAKKPTIHCDMPHCDRRLVGKDDAHLQKRFEDGKWDEPVPGRHLCPECKGGQFAQHRANAAAGKPVPGSVQAQAGGGAPVNPFAAMFGGGQPSPGTPSPFSSPGARDGDDVPNLLGEIPTTPEGVKQAEEELEASGEEFDVDDIFAGFEDEAEFEES